MKKVNIYEMLEDIRILLNLTITQFIRKLNWESTSYYYSIKRGPTHNGNKIKPSKPIINKVFDSINEALEKYEHQKS